VAPYRLRDGVVSDRANADVPQQDSLPMTRWEGHPIGPPVQCATPDRKPDLGDRAAELAAEDDVDDLTELLGRWGPERRDNDQTDKATIATIAMRPMMSEYSASPWPSSSPDRCNGSMPRRHVMSLARPRHRESNLTIVLVSVSTLRPRPGSR
jgi:hypothetical protein